MDESSFSIAKIFTAHERKIDNFIICFAPSLYAQKSIRTYAFMTESDFVLVIFKHNCDLLGNFQAFFRCSEL